MKALYYTLLFFTSIIISNVSMGMKLFLVNYIWYNVPCIVVLIIYIIFGLNLLLHSFVICGVLYMVIWKLHINWDKFYSSSRQYDVQSDSKHHRMAKSVKRERQVHMLLQALVFSLAPSCSQVADVFFKILVLSAGFYTVIYIVSQEAT